MIKFHQVYSDSVVWHFVEVKASTDIFGMSPCLLNLSIAQFFKGLVNFFFLRLEAVFAPPMFLARATHSLTGGYVTFCSCFRWLKCAQKSYSYN